MQRSAAAVATRTTTMCATEEENKKQQGRTLGPAASKGGPSVEALAMAGARRWMPSGACCSESDHVEDDDAAATPPEHLRAFEAFLEEAVPVGMIMASRREEEARLRRGGKPRSYDDDLKEKLKLWARAVARETTGGRR